MAITFVNAKILAGGNATFGEIEKPAGVELNDVMIAVMSAFSPGKVLSLAGGWTKLKEVGNTTYRTALFIRRAGTEEPLKYKLTWEGEAAQWRLGAIAAYRGVRQIGEPYDAFSLKLNEPASKLAVAEAITTTNPNAMVVWSETNQNGSKPTIPESLTKRAEQPLELLLADKIQEIAGNTGAISGALETSVISAVTLVSLIPSTVPSVLHTITPHRGLVMSGRRSQ